MSEYSPDVWVLVELVSEKETLRRILGGWYGGYLGNDSWRLSSPIVSVTEDDNFYYFNNGSGSQYKCHKEERRFSNLTAGIFEYYQKGIEEKHTGEWEMNLVLDDPMTLI